jgi:hypothetical protein
MPDVPASRGYSGGFSAALMAKDLRIAMQLAGATSQPLFMGEKAALLYRQVGVGVCVCVSTLRVQTGGGGRMCMCVDTASTWLCLGGGGRHCES